ncbi:YvrJ family protein [Bacillus nitroreducens]
MEHLLPFIQEVGFPVVVTFYLLHRIETKLDSVIDSIQMLPQNMKADQSSYESKKNIS